MRSTTAKPLPSSLTREEQQKVWSTLERRGVDECWPFVVSPSRGHPQMYLRRELFGITRLVYLIVNNEDPGELEVCHTCDNPRCGNPRHLFLGTKRENQYDKVEKGRQAKGERVNTAVLTEAQIHEVLGLKGKVTGVELARRLGVHFSTVYRIWSGQNWKHVIGKVGR